MFRKLTVAAALTATMIFGGALAASAAEQPDPSPTGQSGYVPRTGAVPTLAGSTAIAQCRGNVPWIAYNVILTDPDGVSTSDLAKLVITDAGHSSTIVLGHLVDGHLQGEVLWPGASVDENGNATGWPGWTRDHGSWVPTDANSAWTRGDIHATLEVNPSLTVPLSYPAATSSCGQPAQVPPIGPAGHGPDTATPTGKTGMPTAGAPISEMTPASAGILAVTGPAVPAVPLSIAGGVIVLVGLALVLARRVRRE